MTLRQAQGEARDSAYWREALLEAALRIAGVLAQCRPPYVVYRARLGATLAFCNAALDGRAEPEIGVGRWAELVLAEPGLTAQELAKASLREALAYADRAGLPRPEAVAIVNAYLRGGHLGAAEEFTTEAQRHGEGIEA